MVIAAGEAEEERQRKPFKTAATTTAEEYEEGYVMAMVPERSRSLHNFSSLPFFNVKWGRQKQLRCVKDATGDQYYPKSSSFTPHHHRRGGSPADRKRRSAAVFDDDGGIEAMREKLMFDLRTEVHQMKAAILSCDGGCSSEKRNGEVVGAVTTAAEARPWNLRTRRAVCKDPNNSNNNVGNGVGGDRRPARQWEVKSPPRRSGELDVHGGYGVAKGPRPKFSASLSKHEIEEDFLLILGNRPARRPKKRPKYVQKQIDALFPGYWLSEITADMYKVNENPESGKR